MAEESLMLSRAVKNESSTLETVKEEELKKLSTSAGEKLKNVTTAEENQKKIKLINNDCVMFEVDPFIATSAGEQLKNVTTAEGNQKKKIKLITKDRDMFEVDPFIAKEMQISDDSVEQNGGDGSVVIQISDVTSRCLRRIIEYFMEVEHCRVAESHNAKEKLKLLDKKFVERMNTNELKELLLAARSLNMENFEKFMIESVANAIKNKSVEFVRQFLCKENDFTPMEEAKHKEENAWAFQNIDQD